MADNNNIVLNIVTDTKPIEAAKQSVNELGTSLNKIGENAAFSAATKEVETFSNAVNGTTKQFTSMRSELKELRNQLQQLEDQGKDNTKEFEQMAIRAGKLQDQIGDTSARIRVLADDSRKIKTLSEAISGVTAAFSIAQGATALLGSENKDLEKSLLKVNAAMAIANGFQQINAMLQKQSYTSVMLNTAAQRAYTFAVGESTGLLKAFRIALAATGIGLIIIGIGALVANWKEFSETLKKSFPALDGVIKFFDNFKTYAVGAAAAVVEAFKVVGDVFSDIFSGEFSKAIDDASNFGKRTAKAFNEAYAEEDAMQKLKAGIKQRQFNLDLMEAQGKDVKAMRLKLLQDELKTLQVGSDEYNAKLIEIEKVRYEIAKEWQEKAKKIKDEKLKAELDAMHQQLDEQYALQLEAAKRRIQIADDEFEKKKKASDDYIKELYQALKDKEQLDIVSANTSVMIAKDGSDEMVKAKKDEIDAIAKAKKEQAQLEIKDADLLAATLHNIDIKAQKDKDELDKEQLKKKKDFEKEVKQLAIQTAKETSDALFQIGANNREAAYNDAISKLESQKEKELSNKNLTEKQKEAINKKYAEKESVLKKQAWEADQKAKIAQAIMNGALAITNILATHAGEPITSSILTAASIATTAAQVAVIQSTPPPKFEQGGLIKGKRHSQGGTIIEAEDGEFVVNRKATAQHYNLLEQLNKGMFTPTLSVKDMANVKFISTQTMAIDYDKLATTLAKKINDRPTSIINIDERGFEKRVVTLRSEFSNNSKRYSFKA